MKLVIKLNRSAVKDADYQEAGERKTDILIEQELRDTVTLYSLTVDIVTEDGLAFHQSIPIPPRPEDIDSESDFAPLPDIPEPNFYESDKPWPSSAH